VVAHRGRIITGIVHCHCDDVRVAGTVLVVVV